MTRTSRPSEPLRRALLDALPPHLRPSTAAEAPTEQALAGLYAAARSAWPGVRVAGDAFVRSLAARLDGEVPPGEGLNRLRSADLYLACACLAGDEAALRALDGLLGQEVDLAWARIEVQAGGALDTRRHLRARLLGSDGQGSAGLDEYGGRGSLRAWLRVIVVREALGLLRRQVRGTPPGERELLALPDDVDPDLERLKRRHRGEIQRAFLEALAELGGRERNLLRSHFLHGLAIDDLAPRFGLHRATATRWLIKVQELIYLGTSRRLSERLRLSREALESVMALVRSRLDVSIRRALGTEEVGGGRR